VFPRIIAAAGRMSFLLPKQMCQSKKKQNNQHYTKLLDTAVGMENIAIFSMYIGYFRYFHFTALDWVMLTERLVFKLYISECGYLE